MLLTISHNFCGGQKEIFKWVVVQNALWTREGKLSVELKILHKIKMLFLHKSDFKTSLDISKFWLKF